MKDLKGLNLGVALCGSFCTFSKAITLIENLTQMGINIFPIMSYNAYETSTRFGKNVDHIYHIESLTCRSIIHTLVDAEPLGPKNILDALLIAPCTGNTLAKLNNSIIDTPVLLAAKSLLRVNKPIIIALSTNDALGLNLKNIGGLMMSKNIFFVPLGQDQPIKKPYSLVADFNKVPDTLMQALNYTQIEPIFIEYPI